MAQDGHKLGFISDFLGVPSFFLLDSSVKNQSRSPSKAGMLLDLSKSPKKSQGLGTGCLFYHIIICVTNEHHGSAISKHSWSPIP